MTKLERDIDLRGIAAQKAWQRVKHDKSWGDWMIIGEGLWFGRQEAMTAAKTNRPEGRAYNEYFSQWLIRYKLKDMDNATRADLLYIMDNRSEIEEYRSTLTIGEKARINHPTTMLRRWRKATQIKPTRAKRAKPADQTKELATLRAHVEDLEAARPVGLAGAREQYLTALQHLSEAERRAEINSLCEQLGILAMA